MTDVCSKCGYTRFQVEEKDNYTGWYCRKCGAFKRKLTDSEVDLVSILVEEIFND